MSLRKVDTEGTETTGKVAVVKKYANRRLYDTSSSAYVTLEDLSALVKRGTDFLVQDARTGEDITRQVLTQIIVEEENRGESLLPIQFLRQLIRFYGGGGPAILPGYLTASMETFARQQESWREAFAKGPTGGFFEEQARQNMALFERTMRTFSPFAASAAAPVEPAPAATGEEITDLKRKVEDMSRQIERLATKE